MMFSTKNIPFFNRRGVSLIELVIVVAIMGIIAGIGIPEYGRFVAKNKVRNAANDLLQEMRRASTMAIKGNREYLMVFDLANQRYLIGFDGSSPPDGDLLDLTVDGFGVCGVAVAGDPRVPVNDVDANGDGIPDCIKVINLSDYGSNVEFGTLAAVDSDGGDTAGCNGRTVCFGTFNDTSETFAVSGAFGNMGRVFIQGTNKGFSYEVEVQNLSGVINLWQWDGDAKNDAVITWREVR